MRSRLVLLLALTALAGGVLSLACGGDEHRQSRAATPTAAGYAELVGWPLRTSNRTSLSLCVDGGGGFLVSDAQVEAVEAALEESLGSIRNPLPEFRRSEVSAGCPPAANLFVTDTGIVLDGLGAKVEQPSRHLVFVYFLPPDTFKPSSDFPYEEMTTEQMCIAYSCYAVTAGLYVNASISQEILREALLRTIGFATTERSPPDFFLLTSNRAHLSLCVDGVEDLKVSSDHVRAVRQALEGAIASVPEVPSEYRRREVSVGCPVPSAQLGQPLSKWDINSRLVDVPSPHRVFVYVLSSGLYSKTFGSEPYVTADEEHVCEGDVCFGVTTGLYLPASGDDDVLRVSLLRALHLVESLPNPEPDIDWQACKRGERPHPDFNCQDLEDWRRDLLALCDKAEDPPAAFPCEDLKDWKGDPEQGSTQ